MSFEEFWRLWHTILLLSVHKKVWLGLNRPSPQEKKILSVVHLLGLVWFYGISTIVGYLKPNSFLYMNCSISNNSVKHKYTIFSIWLIHRTLSSATTAGLSGLGSDGNEGIIRIPQSSSISVGSPWDFLVSYQNTRCWGRELLFWRDAVGVFYSPSRQGRFHLLSVGLVNRFYQQKLYIYIYQPLDTNRMWHNVISNWSLACFNSVLLLLTGWHNMVKGFNLPYYLPIDRRWIVEYISFLGGIITIWNASRYVWYLTLIYIYIYIYIYAPLLP